VGFHSVLKQKIKEGEMKRALLYFLLFTFQYALGQAADTIVYKTGDKLAVKIHIVDGEHVSYYIPPGEQLFSISQAKVADIKFADGTKYSTSQTTESKGATGTSDNKPVLLNVGIGFNSLTAEIPEMVTYSDGGGPVFLTETPAINLMVEYLFLKGLSLGIAGTYQSETDHPYSPQMSETETWVNEQISRYNISGLCLFHFLNSPVNDMYLGFRGGVSSWTDVITSNNASVAGNTLNTTMPFSRYMAGSFQIVSGYRIFLLSNFGIHFEAAIGSPYFFETGITFQLKTRTN
jgi:hypothetical protein